MPVALAAALDVVTLRAKLCDATVYLSDPKNTLEVGDTHAVAVGMAADVFFGDVVFTR
jgi:hypothetical protein